jgi:hypothetical protein
MASDNAAANDLTIDTGIAGGPSGEVPGGSLDVASGAPEVAEARPAFISIPPESILNGQKAPFDLYVIVGSKQVRVFKQSEALERDRFDRYLEKGDEALMARVDSIDGFFEVGIIEMLALAADSSNGPAVRARGVVRALEFAGLDLFLFGFSKENLAMKVDRVHQILQVALPMIQEDKTRPLLVAYRQEKMPASVGTMVGATLIGGALLHKMQSVPAPTFQAFLLATYFRDISLFRNSIVERPAYDQHPGGLDAPSFELSRGSPSNSAWSFSSITNRRRVRGSRGALRGLDIFRMAKIPLAAEKLSELLKVRDLSPQDEAAILEDIISERFARDPGVQPMAADERADA